MCNACVDNKAVHLGTGYSNITFSADSNHVFWGKVEGQGVFRVFVDGKPVYEGKSLDPGGLQVWNVGAPGRRFASLPGRGRHQHQPDHHNAFIIHEPCDRLWQLGGNLFRDNGFGQVARMVYVDAVVDGGEVGEELQGDDLRDGQERFGGAGAMGMVWVASAAMVASPALARARTRAPCWRMSCNKPMVLL